MAEVRPTTLHFSFACGHCASDSVAALTVTPVDEVVTLLEHMISKTRQVFQKPKPLHSQRSREHTLS